MQKYYPANIFCRENVVCLLRPLHIFKLTPELVFIIIRLGLVFEGLIYRY